MSRDQKYYLYMRGPPGVRSVKFHGVNIPEVDPLGSKSDDWKKRMIRKFELLKHTMESSVMCKQVHLCNDSNALLSIVLNMILFYTNPAHSVSPNMCAIM